MEKIKNKFLKKEYIPLILAFFLPIFIVLVVFALHGGYPFGDRCFLRSDMYHQYAPFMTEFLNKLRSGDSLLYSFHVGLGSDFVALYAYYLASPMNWLIVLCPGTHVIEMMFVFIVLKTGLCGFSFSYYLSKHYRKNNYILTMLALFYALGGFACAYNWNIMWLDALWLTPLIVLGLEMLVTEKKFLLYYITLAVAILSNYYIAIMICIFLVLYFFIYLGETKDIKKGKACVRFFGVSFLAGTTSAILLIPEIKMLAYTVNDTGKFPEAMKWYFNLWDELAHFCTGVEVIALKDHWPNIYCGAAVILFVALYVMNDKISWKKKAARLALAAFFLLSFANNYLDFIWHGFHFPNGMPARQSFLLIFLLLTMVYETLIHMEGNTAWHVGIALCIELLILSICELFGDKEVVTVSSLFATGVLAVLYGFLYLIYKYREDWTKTMAVVAALVAVVAETGVNLNLTGLVTTDRNSYVHNRGNFQTLLQLEEELEGDVFARTDKYNRLTKNDACLDGYSSSSIFSSLMNIQTASLLGDLGMESGNNYYCYNGATPLVSAMLSVKYLMTESTQEESPFRVLLGSENGMSLYKNLYTLPLGFMMPEGIEENWTNALENPIENQNALVRSMGVEGDLFVPSGAVMQDSETVIEVETSGYMIGYFKDTEAETIYADYGEKKKTFHNASHVYLLDLGWCEAGDKITVTTSSEEALLLTPYRMNMDVFENAYQKMNSQTLELKSASSSHMEGSIQVKQEGNLFLSIPAEEGWQVFVDGERVEAGSFQDAFLTVHLKDGEHQIKLKYRTPGLFVGGVISLLSILVFFGLYMRSRKKIS